MKSVEQTHCMLNDIDVGKLFLSHIIVSYLCRVQINEILSFTEMLNC